LRRELEVLDAAIAAANAAISDNAKVPAAKDAIRRFVRLVSRNVDVGPLVEEETTQARIHALDFARFIEAEGWLQRAKQKMERYYRS
jgi:hypothetical protein